MQRGARARPRTTRYSMMSTLRTRKSSMRLSATASWKYAWNSNTCKGEGGGGGDGTQHKVVNEHGSRGRETAIRGPERLSYLPVQNDLHGHVRGQGRGGGGALGGHQLLTSLAERHTKQTERVPATAHRQRPTPPSPHSLFAHPLPCPHRSSTAAQGSCAAMTTNENRAHDPLGTKARGGLRNQKGGG